MARTTNGGTAWFRQRLPAGRPELLSVSCPSVSNCMAVCFGSVSWTTTKGGQNLHETARAGRGDGSAERLLPRRVHL